MLRTFQSNFTFPARQINLAGPLSPSGARKVYERARDNLATGEHFSTTPAQASHAALSVRPPPPLPPHPGRHGRQHRQRRQHVGDNAVASIRTLTPFTRARPSLLL